MFFDSHCHLAYPALASALPAVLERAAAQHVTGLLNIGDSLATSQTAWEQASEAQQQGQGMWATAGVHPQNALEFDAAPETTTQTLLQLAAQPLVRAIGEIGLDFVYDETHPQYPGATRPVQEKVLRAQLEIAIQTKLPVVLHNREADAALLDIMQQYAPRLVGGVCHCFGSSLEVARRVLDLGFYLGFTGLITFKNAAAVREVAKFCPLERLLIETDAPYLAPVPYRGKTNEPAYVPLVAATIADLHGLSAAEVGSITSHNARQLLGLEK